MARRAIPLLMAVVLCASPAAPQESPATASSTASGTAIVITGEGTQPAPPPAPPPASGADAPIVVTGKVEPPARKDVYDQAQDITRVDPGMVYEVALPRFAGPLCPGVLGLKTKYAEAMADRMRGNAARLQLKLASPGCSPNLLVALVDSGQATLNELQAKHPDLFALVDAAERKELLTESAPVHVWNNIAVRWTGNGAPPAGWPKEKASVWGQLDRTSMPEAYDIHATLILFDRASVPHLSLTQLADYATMRGLSHTRAPVGDEPLTTILTLFAGDSSKAPAELTLFDIGYLRSLYREADNRPAVSKLLRVRREAEAQAH